MKKSAVMCIVCSIGIACGGVVWAQSDKPAKENTQQKNADNRRQLEPTELDLQLKVKESGWTASGTVWAEGATLAARTSADGEYVEIALATNKIVDGSIETKNFGTILMKKGDSAFGMKYFVTDKQVKDIRKFVSKPEAKKE